MTDQTFEPTAVFGRLLRRATTALLLLSALLAAGCSSGYSPPCDDPKWCPPPTELLRSVTLPNKPTAPLVILPLSEAGKPCDPSILKDLESRIVAEAYTDIYILCPGWSDGWSSSVAWIDAFAAGYERTRTWSPGEAREPDGGTQREYKPLYVGVVFPIGTSNRAFPSFSADPRRTPPRPDVHLTALRNILTEDVDEELIERVTVALRARGHDIRANKLEQLLAREGDLDPPEQIDLADCLLPLYGPQSEPSAPGLRYAATAGRPEVERIVSLQSIGLIGRTSVPVPPISAVELLEVWKDALRTATGTLSAASRPSTEPPAALQPYGLSVPRLIRWALRATDLRLTNDTAYQAGRHGVADLLEMVRMESDARVHLVGHSFGAEAVLSAFAVKRGSFFVTGFLAAPQSTMPATGVTPTSPATEPALRVRSTRFQPVHSMLLLSPLVNHWAMGGAPKVGPDVPPTLQSNATPGAYRIAASWDVRSVVVLYSTNDWFAGVYAPLALRRPSFEGMASPDTWSVPIPGYATMGGVGPSGIDVGGLDPAYRETLIAPGAGAEGPQRYSFPTSGAKVIAIDGSASIAVPGAANDRTIWWLFANQAGTR